MSILQIRNNFKQFINANIKILGKIDYLYDLVVTSIIFSAFGGGFGASRLYVTPLFLLLIGSAFCGIGFEFLTDGNWPPLV